MKGQVRKKVGVGMAKKKLLLFILTLLFIGLSLVTSYGLMNLSTGVEKAFDTGILAGELLIEQDMTAIYPGESSKYVVNSKNIGTLPMLLRCRIEKSWSNSLSDDNIIVHYNSSVWIDGNDGFYYYKGILNPGQQTAQALCDGFWLHPSTKNEYKNLTLDLTASLQCIQATDNALSIWGKSFESLGIVPSQESNSSEVAMVTYIGEDISFSVSSNLFGSFKNLYPGVEKHQKIQIKNNSALDKPVEIFLVAEPFLATEPYALNQDIKELISNTIVSIKYKNGDEIYKGTLGSSQNPISLGTFFKGETNDYSVSLALSETIENKFQGLEGLINWIFSAKETEEIFELVVEPSSMVDYMFGTSATGDTFPQVVIKSMSGFAEGETKDTEIIINGQTYTYESYVINQFAFYRVNEDKSVSEKPTAGTPEDPETAGEYRIKAKPNAELRVGKYLLSLGEATLNTRHLSNEATYSYSMSKLPNVPVDKPTVTIFESTVLINSAGAVVNDTSGVIIIKDSLLDENSQELEMLISSIEDRFKEKGIENDSYEPMRLTLVNSLNGNIYLRTDADSKVTVTLPYPDTTNKNEYDFVALHYRLLLDNDTIHYDISNPDVIVPVKSAVGLQFSVDNFSPFAIGWKKAENKPLLPTIPPDYPYTPDYPIYNNPTATSMPANGLQESGEIPYIETHLGYIYGYPDNSFKPDSNITRAEVALMFYNFLATNREKSYKSTFNDIADNLWYSKAIGYMEESGIIYGYPDGSFKPNQPITRAELTSIVTRFKGLSEVLFKTFNDVKPGHWAGDSIGYAAGKGWVSGYPDGSFRPENNITRAEAVTIINNMLERNCDIDFVKGNEKLLKGFSDVKQSHWAYYGIMEAVNGHAYYKTNTKETWIDIKRGLP